MVTITFFCVSPVTARVAAETICAAMNDTSTARASRRFFMSVLRMIGSTSCPVRQDNSAGVPGRLVGGLALEAEGDQELTGAFGFRALDAERAERLEPAPQLVPAVGGHAQTQHGDLAVLGLRQDLASGPSHEITHGGF